MKVIFKNSNLVFQKGMFKKTIVLKGLMTESVKTFTNMEPLELDPTKCYRITLPKTAWKAENYESSYMVNFLNRKGTIFEKIGTDNMDRFLSLYYETIVYGTDLLSGGVRADKDVEVPITVEEVEIKKDLVFNKNYNINQGVGVYNLHFPFEKEVMYTFDFDKEQIDCVSNKVIYSKDIYAFIDNTIGFGQRYITDTVSYEVSQFGAGHVLATGTANLKIYKISVV